MKHQIPIPTHRPPTTPGEVLQHEFLDPLNITQQTLADATGLSRGHVNGLINGSRAVSPDVALRLELALGMPMPFWLNLQQGVDEYALRQRPERYAHVRSLREDDAGSRRIKASAKKSRG